MIWEDKREQEPKFFKDVAFGEVFEFDLYIDRKPFLFLKVGKTSAFNICKNEMVDFDRYLTSEVCPRKSKLILE